ncbi:MAG: hypothetical protein EG825_03115 [Rhodocyclaceae bacterium]|nr:hypothetical protein [Rhodocyclaceae bacterium]
MRKNRHVSNRKQPERKAPPTARPGISANEFLRAHRQKQARKQRYRAGYVLTLIGLITLAVGLLTDSYHRWYFVPQMALGLFLTIVPFFFHSRLVFRTTFSVLAIGIGVAFLTMTVHHANYGTAALVIGLTLTLGLFVDSGTKILPDKEARQGTVGAIMALSIIFLFEYSSTLTGMTLGAYALVFGAMALRQTIAPYLRN